MSDPIPIPELPAVPIESAGLADTPFRASVQVPLRQSGGMVKIDVVNHSTAVPDLIEVFNALQQQVGPRSVFASRWGISADLTLVDMVAEPLAKPNAKHWWLVLLDHMDQSGLLGVHDLNPVGLPLGKVGVKDGGIWSCTASHELTEILADPQINLCAQMDDDTFVAYEIADPVEADRDGYKVGDVLVSNYVFPEYFRAQMAQENALLDRMGQIKRPFEIRPGGYLSVLNVSGVKGWSQLHGRPIAGKILYNDRPRVGSRRERRRIGRTSWIFSEQIPEIV